MITEAEGSRVTRLDVARKANVSLATVTYSLNPSGKLRIAAKTQERVCKIARQMGYRPSYVHRALSTGKTYAVGMVVEETKSLLFPLYELIMDGCIGEMNAAKGILGSTMQPTWKDSRYEVGGLFANGSAWDGIFTISAAMSRAVAEAAAKAGRVPGRDFVLIGTDAFPETESYVSTPRAPRCESAVYWLPAREVGRPGWCILRDLIQGKAVAPTTRVPYVRETIA